MIVQTMRLKHGWSQQQLADICGLNIRTIQRIESGDHASLESYKALGAAFNVDFLTLKEEQVRDIVSSPEQIEVTLAFQKARKVRGFFSHLTIYLMACVGFVALNLLTSPQHIWFIFPIFGWGMGVLSHAAGVFNLIPWFGADWEKRYVERQLGREL